MAGLGKFEGREVEGIKAIITKTGDGLSAAMDVEPMLFHPGDHGYVVIEFQAQKVRFDPLTERDRKRHRIDNGKQTLWRVQILEAQTASFVDPDLVSGLIEEMKDRIQARQDELSGQGRIFDGGRRFGMALAEDGDGGTPE